MSKAFVWVGMVFTPIGLAMLVFAGWFYLGERSLTASGLRASGTVIEMAGSRDSDGSYTSRPVVEFIDAGGARRVFESRVSSSPPRYSPGDTVEVIYPQDRPYDAAIDSLMDRWFLPLLFGGMGVVFAGLGGGFLLGWARRRRIVAELLATGVPIQAKFVESYRDLSISVNQRHPWRVVCQAIHPATGKLQSFESDPVWVNPAEQLAGRSVRVLIDPADPKRHHVDLSPYVAEADLA